MTARWVPVDGGDLAVVDQGEGEAVLCIGGAVVADAFAPLFRETAFTTGRRVVRLHRRGYGRTTAPAQASVYVDAADCGAVLDALGIERVHVVGWSYGGLVALQLALDRPASVASVVLLEAALLAGPSAAAFGAALGPVFDAWEAGDGPAALDRFHAAIGRPGWRSESEVVIPGSVAQAEWDAAGAFASDLPAMAAWMPGAARIRAVGTPVLQVTAEGSGPAFAEIRDLVTAWLPQTRNVQLPGGDHSFPVARAADLVAPLTEFLDRHRSAAAQPA